MFLRLHAEHELFLFEIEKICYEGITNREQKFINRQAFSEQR